MILSLKSGLGREPLVTVGLSNIQSHFIEYIYIFVQSYVGFKTYLLSVLSFNQMAAVAH